MAHVTKLPAIAGAPPQLPERLRRKVDRAISSWFERLGEPSRILYRRGLVHFALWLRAEGVQLNLVEPPEPGSANRARWEDQACHEAGKFLLGFKFFEAVHLTEAYLADCLFEEPRLARATVEGRLASLRWAAREARRQSLIDWDLRGARMPKAAKNREGRLKEKSGRDMRGPSPADKLLLLATAERLESRVETVVAMALNEGYREHEIRQINAEDLELASREVWLVRKKQPDPSRYPLSTRTYDALDNWLCARPGKLEGPLLFGGRADRKLSIKRVGQKTIFRWVRSCCESAQTRIYSPHRFRHRACTDIVNWCTKNGIAEERILFLTGHSSRSALQPYYDEIQQAADLREALDYGAQATTIPQGDR